MSNYKTKWYYNEEYDNIFYAKLYAIRKALQGEFGSSERIMRVELASESDYDRFVLYALDYLDEIIVIDNESFYRFYWFVDRSDSYITFLFNIKQELKNTNNYKKYKRLDWEIETDEYEKTHEIYDV